MPGGPSRMRAMRAISTTSMPRPRITRCPRRAMRGAVVRPGPWRAGPSSRAPRARSRPAPPGPRWRGRCSAPRSRGWPPPGIDVLVVEPVAGRHLDARASPRALHASTTRAQLPRPLGAQARVAVAPGVQLDACASARCAAFTWSRSGSMKSETSISASRSVFTTRRSCSRARTTSRPPSVVSSSRRSGTSVTTSGFCS